MDKVTQVHQLGGEVFDYPLGLLVAVKKAMFQFMEDPDLEDARAVLQTIERWQKEESEDHGEEERRDADEE